MWPSEENDHTGGTNPAFTLAEKADGTLSQLPHFSQCQSVILSCRHQHFTFDAKNLRKLITGQGHCSLNFILLFCCGYTCFLLSHCFVLRTYIIDIVAFYSICT